MRRRAISLVLVREGLLLLTVLAGALNFSTALFSSTSISAAPLWTKAARDIPVVLLLAVLLIEVAKTRPRWDRRDRRYALALGAMAAYMVASVVAISLAPAGDAVSARYYLVYPLVGLLLTLVETPYSTVRRLVILVVALGVGEALLAIPDFLVAFGPTYYGGAIPIGHARYNRAIATLGNPNNLGLFLGLAMLLAAAALPWVRVRWRVAACVVMGVGLFLTFSKTAAIALSLSTIVVVRGSVRRRLTVTGIAIAGACAFAVLSIVVRSGYQPIHATAPPTTTTSVPSPSTHTTPASPSPTKRPHRRPGVSATNAAFGTRGANVRRAFHRWTRTPRSFLFGYGFATLGDVGSGGRLTEYVVDDMPLGLALEGGAAGIVLFLALVVCCLWLAFARGLRDPFVDSARAYAVFFLLYLPISVNFRLFPAAPFFWIFMGLAASLARAHRRSVAEGGDRLGGAFTGTAVPERDPTELA